MNKTCIRIQEKLACSINLEFADQGHLTECSKCQNVFADYQMLMFLLDEAGSKTEVPEHFADAVMNSIQQLQTEGDWYEQFSRRFGRLLDNPLIQYGSLATGFGVGILTFVRFVAFVFIPA